MPQCACGKCCEDTNSVRWQSGNACRYQCMCSTGTNLCRVAVVRFAAKDSLNLLQRLRAPLPV